MCEQYINTVTQLLHPTTYKAFVPSFLKFLIATQRTAGYASSLSSVSFCVRNCAPFSHTLLSRCISLIFVLSLNCFESGCRSVWMRVVDIANFSTFVNCCAAWTSFTAKYYSLKDINRIIELALVRIRMDDQTKVSLITSKQSNNLLYNKMFKSYKFSEKRKHPSTC